MCHICNIIRLYCRATVYGADRFVRSSVFYVCILHVYGSLSVCFSTDTFDIFFTTCVHMQSDVTYNDLIVLHLKNKLKNREWQHLFNTTLIKKKIQSINPWFKMTKIHKTVYEHQNTQKQYMYIEMHKKYMYFKMHEPSKKYDIFNLFVWSVWILFFDIWLWTFLWLWYSYFTVYCCSYKLIWS